MRLIKYLFIAYLALIALAVCGYTLARLSSPPRDPDTLFTIYISSIRSLDPTEIADVGSSDIMGHVYECLYNYKYGGKPDELIPQLAADFPEISDDRLTYTIPLRRGVRFYDPAKTVWPDGVGPEVTAEDVIYSWKRMANFHTAAPSYSTVLQDNIAGLDDFRAYTEKAAEDKVDYDRPVAGLTALDDHTLRVTLTKPIPNFLQLSAYLGLAVISRESIDKLGSLKEHPVATGPYVVSEYRNEQRLVLETNPVYRGRPDVDGEAGAKLPPAERLPHIKRIQFDYFLETLPAWHLFLQGRYDVMSIPKETYKDAVVEDRGTKEKTINPQLAAKGIQLRIRPDLGLYYLQFNTTDPVLGKNKPLRQALSLAVDRATYLRVFRNGRGTVATGILPPDAPLYDPAYRSPWCVYDVSRARAMVGEAERVHGGKLPKLKLLMGDTGTEERQYAEFFVQQWAKVGLEVEAEYSTYARFLERMDAKDYQITYTGWVPDYPDEKTYLRLFDATLATPPGSNSTGYNNPEFQAVLEKALVLDRSPERDELYRKMRDIIDEDVPVAPLFYPLIFGLRYDWVGNGKPAFFTQGFYAHQTLDTARRRKALGH